MVYTNMKIHKFGKFHQYSICHCQFINLKCFSYWFSIHEIHLFGRFSGPYSPKYSLILLKFSPEVVLQRAKTLFKRQLKDSNFYRKGTDPKVPLFVYLSPPLRKNLSHWIMQICQNQNSISSSLSGKTTITFCII